MFVYVRVLTPSIGWSVCLGIALGVGMIPSSEAAGASPGPNMY